MGRGLNWGVFNSWWREHLAKHGERPKAEDLKRWYTEESRRAFPSDPPTYTMIRNHAKGLRDIAAVKHYFRDYRARKRRAFADLEGLPTSKPLQTGEPGAAGEGGSGSGSGDDATGNAGGASPAVRAQHPASAQRPRRRQACGGGGGRGGGGRGRGSSCSGDTTEVDTEEEEGGEDGMSCSSDEDWSSEGGPKRRRQQGQQQQQQQRRRAQRQAAAALAPWSATAVEQAGLTVDTDLAFGSGGRRGAQAPCAPEQGFTLSVARGTACGPPASPSHQPPYHQYQPDGEGGDVGLEDLPTVTVRVTSGGRGAAGALSHAGKQACGDCDDAMDAAAGATVQCKREPDACGEEAGTPTKRLATGRGTPRSSFAPFLARIHALPPALARPRATATAAASEPPAANPSSMARGGAFAAAAAAALAGAALKGAAPAGGAAAVAGTAAAAAGGHHEEGLFMGLHGVGGTPAGGAGSLGPREFTGSVSIGGGNGGGCRGSGCVTSGSLGLTVAAAEGGAPGNGTGGSSSGAGASGGGGVVSPSGGGSRGGSFTSQQQRQQQQQQQQQVWTPFAITVPGAASVTAPVGSFGRGTGPRQSTNNGAMGTEPAAAAAADAAAAAAAGTGATPARDVDTAAPSSDGAPEATEAAAAAKPQAKHSVGGEAAVAAAPVVTPADAPSNDSDATRLELVLGGSDKAHAAAAGAATANSQPGADQGRTPAAASLLRLHHLEDGSGSGTARAASGTFATLATLPPSPALHHPPPPGGYPRADSPAGAAARRGAVPWLHHPAHHTHLLSLAAAGRAESSPLSHASPRAHLQLQLQHGGLDNSGGCDGGSGSAGVTAAMAAGSGPGSPAAWPPAHLAACGRQMSLPNLPHLGEGALPGSSHASAVASPALRVPPALHPSTQAAAAPVGPPPVTTGFAPSKNLRNAGPLSASASATVGGGSPSSPSGGASPAALRPPPVTSLTRGVATPPPGGSVCQPDGVGVAAGAGPMQLQEDHSPSPRPGAYPDWATAGAAAAEPNPSTSNTSADGDAAAPPPQPPGWGPRPGPPFARARWYPHGHPNPHHPGGWYPYPYPYPPHLRPHHPYPGAAGSPPGAAGVAAAAASQPGMPPYPYLGPYGPVRRRYTSAPSQPFPHLQHPQHFYATPPGAGGATAGAPGPSRLAGGARGPDGSRAAALELLAADPWMAQGYEDVRPAGMASAAAAGAGAAEGCGGASTSGADADPGAAAGGAGGRLLPLPLPLPAGADQAASPHPAAVPHGAHAPAWPPPSSAAAHNYYYHPYARQSTDTYGGFGNEYAGAATAAAAAGGIGGMGGAPRTSNGAGSGQGSGGGGLDDLWGMCDDQMMSHVLDMFDNNEFPPHASHLAHPAQHNPCGPGNAGGGGGLPQPQSAPHMPQPHSSRLTAAGAVGSGAAAGTAQAGAWQVAGPAGMWPAAVAPGGGGLPYYCTTADATSSGGAPPHHAPH